MAEGSNSGVLRELIAVFGFGVDTSELKEGENKLEEFLGKLKKIAGGVAAAFAIHEIAEFAENTTAAMTAIERTSAQLGVSTERVQEFQFAAKSMGMDADALTDRMGRLQVAQQAAAQGGAAQAGAFSRIGVSLRDANGELKSADALFLDVAEGIKNTKNASVQAAAAQALFGRGGRQLLPFLKEGKAGFAELVAEYKELGGGYSEEAIKKAKAYEKEQARLGLATTSLKGTISAALLPILGDVVRALTQGVVWLRKVTEHSNIVKAVLYTLGAAGAVFAAQMTIAGAPVLLLAAALGGIILLVDDFITMLEGGDSEIGDLIDRIFGKDAHVEVVKDLKAAWVATAEAVKQAYEYVKKFFDVLEKAGGAAGDAAARARNTVVEEGAVATGSIRKGRGGLTYEESVMAREAERYLKAKSAGAAYNPAEIPKGYDREAMINNIVQNWAPAIRRGDVAGYGGAPGSVTIENLNVHAAPGMDEKKLAEHVPKEIAKHAKQQRRETAATYQRGNQAK